MKKYFSAVLAVIMLLFCVSCSKEESKAEPAITEVAEELLACGCFSETLSEVDSEIGAAVYELDANDIESSVFYMSTGATAEEFSAFRAKDSDAAARIKSAIEQRVSRQSASYASYGPSEVPKLEKAEIRVIGSTVVFCVCSDYSPAAEILDKYF